MSLHTTSLCKAIRDIENLDNETALDVLGKKFKNSSLSPTTFFWIASSLINECKGYTISEPKLQLKELKKICSFNDYLLGSWTLLIVQNKIIELSSQESEINNSEGYW